MKRWRYSDGRSRTQSCPTNDNKRSAKATRKLLESPEKYAGSKLGLGNKVNWEFSAATAGLVDGKFRGPSAKVFISCWCWKIKNTRTRIQGVYGKGWGINTEPPDVPQWIIEVVARLLKLILLEQQCIASYLLGIKFLVIFLYSLIFCKRNIKFVSGGLTKMKDGKALYIIKWIHVNWQRF